MAGGLRGDGDGEEQRHRHGAECAIDGGDLGQCNGTPVTQTLGDLAPGGGTAVVTVNYTTAAASGTAAVEKYTGSYVGGTFAGSIRATLP